MTAQEWRDWQSVIETHRRASDHGSHKQDCHTCAQYRAILAADRVLTAAREWVRLNRELESPTGAELDYLRLIATAADALLEEVLWSPNMRMRSRHVAKAIGLLNRASTDWHRLTDPTWPGYETMEAADARTH